jgi:hypothetical protein
VTVAPPSPAAAPAAGQTLTPAAPAPSAAAPPAGAAPSADAQAKPDAAAAAAPAAAAPSDLVFFISPLSLEVPKGQTIRASLMVSGAGGLTSGTMQLRLDPKLTLKNFAAGDFLTGDGGSLEGAPDASGNLNLTFKRKTGAMDSGTFATLDLMATAPGNAPILIQGGQYLVGSNPISARVVNALITVN